MSAAIGVLARHGKSSRVPTQAWLLVACMLTNILPVVLKRCRVCVCVSQVDVLAWRSKTSRVHAQIKDFCAILSGLVVAQDYKRGQQLVADKDFDQNADFFQVRLSRYLGCMSG
jgi:hypothetical protein